MKQKNSNTRSVNNNNARFLSDKVVGYGKDGLKVLGGAAAFWGISKLYGVIKATALANKLSKEVPNPTE